MTEAPHKALKDYLLSAATPSLREFVVLNPTVIANETFKRWVEMKSVWKQRFLLCVERLQVKAPSVFQDDGDERFWTEALATTIKVPRSCRFTAKISLKRRYHVLNHYDVTTDVVGDALAADCGSRTPPPRPSASFHLPHPLSPSPVPRHDAQSTLKLDDASDTNPFFVPPPCGGHSSGANEGAEDEDDGCDTLPRMPTIVNVPSDYQLIEPMSFCISHGIDVAKRFYLYQRQALARARNEKLTLECNAHEILSLSYILLIKPGQHSKGLLSCMTADEVEAIMRISKVTINLPEYELDDETELMLRNCGKLLQKTPPTKNPDIERTYLTNILQSDSGTKEAIKRGRRPDFKLVRVHQGREDAESGFGEVKPTGCKDDTYMLNLDLIRIGRFGKQCVDSLTKAGVINPVVPLFQAVGQNICFYGIFLLADGIYVMAEIGKVVIPLCAKELLRFVDEVHTLVVFRNMCMRITDVIDGDRQPVAQAVTRLRTTLTTPQFNEVLEPSRSRKRRGSIFHTSN
ncbi:hypothetical protein BC832DRAFT_538548 [Gaertneriomyces semiglobifer]|nr:hypothetical protein BC832DRAFT_538548 [Gaertneriomyces semiglobifer]